jgi:hypothetical protein
MSQKYKLIKVCLNPAQHKQLLLACKNATVFTLSLSREDVASLYQTTDDDPQNNSVLALTMRQIKYLDDAYASEESVKLSFSQHQVSKMATENHQLAQPKKNLIEERIKCLEAKCKPVVEDSEDSSSDSPDIKPNKSHIPNALSMSSAVPKKRQPRKK